MWPQANPKFRHFEPVLRDGSISRSIHHHGRGSDPGLSLHRLISPAGKSFFSSSGTFLPPPAHPGGGMQPGQSRVRMETAAPLANAQLKPFSRHLPALHTHPAVQEANNYLLSNIFNKESKEKKSAFRTSRITYRFLQSWAGFLRVIRLQVIDSGVL